MQLITMVVKQLQLMLRNRMALLAILASPVLLAYFFSVAQADNRAELYIADGDQSPYSARLIDGMRAHQNMDITLAKETDIREKVMRHDISSGLVIEPGFGDYMLTEHRPLHIKMIQERETGDNGLEAAVTEELALLLSGKEASLPSPDTKSSAAATGHEADHTEAISQRLTGFMLMFVWFAVIQGFRTFIDEQENRMLYRLLSTPVRFVKYLLSKVIAAYLFGLLTIGLVLCAGKWILNINITGGMGVNMLIWASYLLAVTGVVTLLVPWVRSHQSFTICGSVIMVFTGILGGAFFPVQNPALPEWFRFISRAVPGTWAWEGLNGATSALTSSGLLSGLGFFGLSLSFVLISFRIQRRRTYE
ncbi:ABC transporter permease [Paenibacillus melissococcoides]|uniref:ABC transporter permease n=1 Tax=Paenibacillus melissococcoides TaxID=2912268 RepID=A0ABM9FZ58_9BACL|nr:ABC transporter permease [Paenibacillus melissococcoides]CAH8244183.1 ABC transporter permease [Paenibacillus melissococcoides]CAH8703703.1 ABC transporter permease [Paenibacillus melissococcoides]CAH8706209.1 ABC transporter permease [Paenibacillus melissococcoides]